MAQEDDPEIAAMAAIASALAPLDIKARCRIVGWAVSRWGERVEVAPSQLAPGLKQAPPQPKTFSSVMPYRKGCQTDA